MAVGLVLPFANTQTMALHLHAISQAVPPGRHALLILDQAGWHTTLKLPQLPNLSLLMLPAVSPELNPAEHVRQQLRDRSLANDAMTITSRSLMPAATPGINSHRFPAPFVHCVRVVGLLNAYAREDITWDWYEIFTTRRDAVWTWAVTIDGIRAAANTDPAFCESLEQAVRNARDIAYGLVDLEFSAR